MKIRSRKLLVFVLIHFTLMGFYIAGLTIAPDTMNTMGPSLIWAMIANGATFITGRVLDDRQKSKYYRPELDPMMPNPASYTSATTGQAQNVMTPGDYEKFKTNSGS